MGQLVQCPFVILGSPIHRTYPGVIRSIRVLVSPSLRANGRVMHILGHIGCLRKVVSLSFERGRTE